MKKIESVNNQYIKDLFKLHEKKYRDIENKFLIEGKNLVLEAYKTSNLEVVLTTDESFQLEGIECIFVSENIIQKLAHTKSPQNIIGVCKYLKAKLSCATKYLLLDEIQDPGNLGTLVRSSLGFNIDKIYISNSTVDIYNDKFVRSSGGAIFHIDIEVVELKEKILELIENGVEVFGTSLDEANTLENTLVPSKYAILLGNEGSGVKKELLEITSKNIYIQTNPLLESLNVAIAGSIILYYFDKKKS